MDMIHKQVTEKDNNLNIIPTNKESAEILRGMLSNVKVPRGCSKSLIPLFQKQLALGKAIKLLENTPD